MAPSSATRRVGMTLIAVYAVLCGLREIIVGFTGNFLGILSNGLRPNVAVGVVGGFYLLGGLVLLTNRK